MTTVHERNHTRPYWPALDGWRGLTIWVAISVHAGYFTAGGVLSLDTFFVLSGFLITGILLREWLRSEEQSGDGQGRIDLVAFWARRARRLLPALFVVLGAVLVYAAVLAPALGLDRLRGDTLSSLFYVTNWHFVFSGQSYFSGFTTPSPLLHLWSLAVEEQFYLFWPPIVLGVLWFVRRRLRRRAEVAILVVGAIAVLGAIASAVLMTLLYEPGKDPSRVYYGTDTRAQAMLVGAALAVVVTLHGPLRSRIGRGALSVTATLGFVVVVLPWFASSAPSVHDFFYGRFGLLAYSCATAAVLWRLAQPAPGVLGRGLQLRPARWVGDISYEMYLWHWPLYLVITPARTGLTGGPLLVVRLASVVALAAVTHFFVGEPIRRGARLNAPRLARLATAAAVIVVGASVFLATVGARPALTGDVGELADRGGPPRSAPAAPAAGDDASPIKVLVVGDSQGATLAQGLDAAPGAHGLSAQPGLRVWNRAILGCSITTAKTFVIDGELVGNRCGATGAWQEQWASDVAEFDPDVAVVQAGAWDVYDVAGPDGTIVHPGSREWRDAYRRDVEQLWSVLGAGGAKVVAVRPPCYGRSEVVGAEGGPSERFDPARIAAVEQVWSAVARTRGDDLLDLDPVLCPRGVSDATIRPDGAHYGDEGSDRIATLVADAVRARTAGRRTAEPAPSTRPAETSPLVSHLSPVDAPQPGGDADFTWYTHPTPAGRTVMLGVLHSPVPGPRPAILVAPSAVGLNVDYLPYARRLAARGFDVAVSCWFAPTITPDLADVLIPCPDAPVYAGVVDAAIPEFDAVVEAAHELFGPERGLAVLGPSRGAAIAALRASAGRPEPVVLISGRYESVDPVVGAGADVVARASGFRAPALVLHGVADGVIPVAEAQHLESALRANGADVVARYYDGAGHNLDGEPVARDDMENLVVDFLCARLTCAR